jgi:hypothetical protein
VLAYDHISYPLSKAVETPITKVAIANAPKWNDTQENPPISARSALTIATKERDRIDTLLNYDRKVWSWKLKAVSLKPFEGGGWYWLIQFEQFGPDIAGQIPFLHIPVLMDGKPAVDKVRDTTEADFLFGP